MIKSELYLDVSNSLNQKLLRVFDASHYCEGEVLDNYLVEVLPVNKGVWVPLLVKKGYSLVLNSSSLRYNKVDSVSDLIDLQDGIYEFKISVKPNIANISHFYHLRTIGFQRNLQSEFSKLIEGKCDISKFDYNLNKLKLRDIEEYISAAKWAVEECQDKKRGKEMYEFAQTLLKQYTNECKC